MRWFFSCWLVVYCYPHCLLGVLCLVLILLCSGWCFFSSFSITLTRKRELILPYFVFLMFCDSSSWWHGFVYSVIVLFSDHTILLTWNLFAEEESVGCFDYIVFLMSYGYYFLSLSKGPVGWCIVCDCGISWSYTLFSKAIKKMHNIFIVYTFKCYKFAITLCTAFAPQQNERDRYWKLNETPYLLYYKTSYQNNNNNKQDTSHCPEYICQHIIRCHRIWSHCNCCFLCLWYTGRWEVYCEKTSWLSWWFTIIKS